MALGSSPVMLIFRTGNIRLKEKAEIEPQEGYQNVRNISPAVQSSLCSEETVPGGLWWCRKRTGGSQTKRGRPAASKSAKPLFTDVFYIEVLLLNVVLCFNV